MEIAKLFGNKSFPHGIHPPDFKEETRDKKVRRLPFAPEIVLPLSQHIGRPSIPIVHKGQEVERGELIAVADGTLSVPLHASVAGTVTGIELRPNAGGHNGQAIVIRTSRDSGQIPLRGEPRNPGAMSRAELLDAVQETGLVGLGGAGFPTHAKMRIPESCIVHTVIVNGCECEPFMTTDHRVMLEQADNLLCGIRIALRCVGAGRAIIGIEDNKLDVVAAIRRHLPPDSSVSVATVAAKYPQGAEKMLIKSLLGIEIPSGQYPASIGVCVFNVATLAELGVLLPNGQGLIERVITITGDDLEKPGNYLAPIGTPLRYILEYAGFKGTAAEVIVGGPMMGAAAPSLDIPVTKGCGTVLVMDQRMVHSDAIQPCIKCAACLRACPVNLNPAQLGQLAAKRQYALMEEQYYLNDCIECGCCSYVCPSNIPLVQYFRIAKALNRERRLHG